MIHNVKRESGGEVDLYGGGPIQKRETQTHNPPPAATKPGNTHRMNLTHEQFAQWARSQGLTPAIGRSWWGTLPEMEGKDLPFTVEGDAVSFRVVRLGDLAGGYSPGVEFGFWEVSE